MACPYANAVLERLSFEKLHHNKGLPLVFIDVVNCADVGMVECGSGLRFTLESFQGLSVFRKSFRQEFQGDSALELGVLGPVDDAHAAATQLLQDAIVRNGLTNHARNQPLGAILGCACRQVNVQMGAQYAAELPYELVQLPRAGPEDVC